MWNLFFVNRVGVSLFDLQKRKNKKISVDKEMSIRYNNTCVDKENLFWKKVMQDKLRE